MAVDISQYLDAIMGDTDGEEVIQAIHDAALRLGTEAYKTASIDELLEDIKTKIYGKEIRMDIHEILKRLSEAVPEPSSKVNIGVVNGDALPVCLGWLSEIDTVVGIMVLEE